MIEAIPSHCILTVWGSVAPILQRAIDRSQHDYSLLDVLHALTTQQMQLWVWIEETKIVAVCVTHIQNYPQRRVCQLPFVAGKARHLWPEFEPILIKWAKANGCTQLEGFCRDGWLRVLSPFNWLKVWNTMRKEI